MSEKLAQNYVTVKRRPNYKPVVTYAILGITVFVYVLEIVTKFFLGTSILLDAGMKVNEYIVSGQYWRLLTPIFLHDDHTPFHLIFNMVLLFSMGTMLEEDLGHWRFLLLYLLSGFAGNVFSFILVPNPSVGASSALYGLIGAQAIYLLQNIPILKKRVFGVKLEARSLLIIAAACLIDNFLFPNLNYWAHIGGLVGGIIVSWLAGPKLGLEEEFMSFQAVDMRSWREQLGGAVLVAVIFGASAALKISGIVLL